MQAQLQSEFGQSNISTNHVKEMAHRLMRDVNDLTEVLRTTGSDDDCPLRLRATHLAAKVASLVESIPEEIEISSLKELAKNVGNSCRAFIDVRDKLIHDTKDKLA